MDDGQTDENSLLTLCDKQKQLLTKCLVVILGACAISFLVTYGLVRIDALQWVWVIDVGVFIYYKVSYRQAVKKFDSAIDTPMQAYCNAKMRQYNALAAVSNANCVVAVLCPSWWIFLAAFVLWFVLFWSLPKMSELQKDFGYDQ